MNERPISIALIEVMQSAEGWGRAQGRIAYQQLLNVVEENPGAMIFKLSLKGVRRIDISFASEAIVELARRFRGSKGFCVVDLSDRDMIENLDAAAERKSQPVVAWRGKNATILGPQPTEGTREALGFAMQRGVVRATEFSSVARNVSIANSSTKFKQLWEQGFLLRRDSVADSGGIEFLYYRVG
ncbi:MAG: hypothetical protein O3B65_03660 [Chloroflexi bacterium]|nr:hypothetical protein [Chloroflexota bacterium]